MNNHNEPREWIARVIHSAEIGYGNDDLEPFDELDESTRGLALAYGDAVIADLWDRADDPEVVEAVARSGVADWGEYVPDGPLHTGLRDIARKEITAMLTALIGPKPEEVE